MDPLKSIKEKSFQEGRNKYIGLPIPIGEFLNKSPNNCFFVKKVIDEKTIVARHKDRNQLYYVELTEPKVMEEEKIYEVRKNLEDIHKVDTIENRDNGRNSEMVNISEGKREGILNVRIFKGKIKRINPIIDNSKILMWEIEFLDEKGPAIIFLGTMDFTKKIWYLNREVILEVYISDKSWVKSIADISE